MVYMKSSDVQTTNNIQDTNSSKLRTISDIPCFFERQVSFSKFQRKTGTDIRFGIIGIRPDSVD